MWKTTGLLNFWHIFNIDKFNRDDDIEIYFETPKNVMNLNFISTDEKRKHSLTIVGRLTL